MGHAHCCDHTRKSRKGHGLANGMPWLRLGARFEANKLWRLVWQFPWLKRKWRRRRLEWRRQCKGSRMPHSIYSVWRYPQAELVWRAPSAMSARLLLRPLPPQSIDDYNYDNYII